MVLFLTATNQEKLFFGKMHLSLYYLTLAMYPRMMISLDEDLKPLKVPVRVGEALDTVAVAGTPK